MKYAWIKGQSGDSVRVLCRVLGVSTSGFYQWRGRAPSAHALDDARLVERITVLHQQTREAYGSDRLWQALRQEGEACGRHRVRRLRTEHDVRTQRRRRYLRTRSPYQRNLKKGKKGVRDNF